MNDENPRSPMVKAMHDHMTRDRRSGGNIAAEHDLVRNLCADLEAIADQLPALPRPGEVAVLAAALRSGIPAHCRHEEAELRWHILQRSGPRRLLSGALDQLILEHRDNEPLGHELADLLEAAVLDNAPVNPDALGYLIRLYFQTMQRHLQWEDYVMECLSAEEDDG